MDTCALSPHFGQRLKDPSFTSSWTLARLVLRLARYQPSIPTTLQTLASIVNLTMANNHNQDPNLIPALPHPDAYYESSFPLKDQYSAQRGDYQTSSASVALDAARGKLRRKTFFGTKTKDTIGFVGGSTLSAFPVTTWTRTENASISTKSSSGSGS